MSHHKDFVDDAIVSGLKELTTCDASDALLKLKIPHGGYLSGLSLWSPERQDGPTKIVGPAYTVRYVRNHYANAPKFEGHYIDGIPKGAVVFISSPPRIVNAVYGGLMSCRAKYSGAVGTVVDGRIRDLQEHRELDYPVFARDVGTAAPYEVVKVSEVDVPIRLQSDEQDAFIHPGDYIIGDLNGVVCIPRALAEEVIALARSQVAADEKLAEDLKRGLTFSEASKIHRAHVLRPEELEKDKDKA